MLVRNVPGKILPPVGALNIKGGEAILMKVLVLMGGTSAEREVSLRSGSNAAAALQEKGYQVETMDLGNNNIDQIKQTAPDVVFIALHGQNGEDGTVQGYLELLGIPYTGSGVATSAICMNKVLTKKLLGYDGLPTPDYVVIEKNGFQKSGLGVDCLIDNLGLPLVVKAATQGSSIGTYIVSSREEILPAILEAFAFDNQVLLEKFIDGVLLTVSILGNDDPLVLPIIEIVSQNEFYDYESKYTPGMSDHIIPARISAEAAQRVNQISEQAYRLMGCRGFARVDLIVDRKGQPYILELNTIPGLTETSLVPDAARAVGIDYPELIERLVNLALPK